MAVNAICSTFSFFGRCLSFSDWMPAPQIDPVSERYLICKDIYIPNLKQAPYDAIKWPNDKS